MNDFTRDSSRAAPALPLAAAALVLLALAAVPLVAPLLGMDYYIGFVRRILIVVLAAMSLNFLIGRAGMVALGHAGFVGVGAYVVVAASEAGLGSAWLIWLLAVVVATVVAAAVGAVALRTRGVYFIMITLAFAQMLYYLAVSVRRYGGDDGYTLYSPLVLGSGAASWPAGGNPLYWAVLALVAAVFVLQWRVDASRFGRALEGIRDNETRMQAMGYPVYALKLCAYAAAGGIAGLSGALMATQNAFVSPTLMHWTQSATLIVMVVVGGIGHRWGAPLGVAMWMVIEEVLRQYTEYWHAPMGLLLIAVVFFAPRGLAAGRARRRAA